MNLGSLRVTKYFYVNQLELDGFRLFGRRREANVRGGCIGVREENFGDDNVARRERLASSIGENLARRRFLDVSDVAAAGSARVAVARAATALNPLAYLAGRQSKRCRRTAGRGSRQDGFQSLDLVHLLHSLVRQDFVH